jgi:signal peptidase II
MGVPWSAPSTARESRGVRRHLLISIVAIIATVGCDRFTKRLATEHLPHRGTLSFLGDTVRVEYMENPGAFLGLGSHLPVRWRFVLLLLVHSTALLVCAGALLRDHRSSSVQTLAWSLLLAGGGSNLADRLWRSGYVIDFLNVGLGPVRTGVFNVADMAITTAVVVLALSWRRKAPAAPAGSAHDDSGV